MVRGMYANHNKINLYTYQNKSNRFYNHDSKAKKQIKMKFRFIFYS